MAPLKFIHPPILLALSLIIGAHASVPASASLPLSVFVLILVLVGLVVVCVMRSRRWSFAAVCCMTVLAGFALGSLALHRARDVHLPADAVTHGAPLMCEARASSGVVRRHESAHLDVDLRACRPAGADEDAMQAARGRVRIYSSPDMPVLDVGDIVRFKSRIRRPVDFRNPAGFSWERHLAARGIGATGSLAGPRWIMRVHPTGDGVRRASIISRLQRHLDAELHHVKGDGGGIMRALILGDRDAVPGEMRAGFQRTGIAHILAISGLHVGYLAFMVYLIVAMVVGRLSWLVVRVPVQRCAAVVTIPVLWGFIMLVGAPVSAVRAGIMVSVYLIGVIGGMRRDLLSTLAVAALIIVAVNPLAVTEVSFQLSFVSVLAIILLVPRMMAVVNGWFEGREGLLVRALYRAVQLMAVTAAATVGSAPLIAYHFHLVVPAGLALNMIAVPWLGAVVLPLMVAAIVASFIVPGWTLPWIAAGKAASLLAVLVQKATAIADHLNISIAPNIAEVMLAYAAFAVVIMWRRLVYRRAIVAAVCALIIADGAWWHVRPLFSDTLAVTYLDVGQGDAAIVRFPRGRTMLIDGGGRPRGTFDIGERVVVPALMGMGIRRVDWLVLSHPHYDHYRGLAAVSERYLPAVLMVNGAKPPEAERALWEETTGRIQRAGTRIAPIGADDLPHEIGGVRLELLHPSPGDAYEDPNDASIVLKATYGDVSFIFTGDLTKQGERDILERGTAVDATVLKVGHHGSNTSTTADFLDAVKPRIAVISLGRHNSFGMPHSAVIDRLERAGARIYRTDRHGAVTIRTDGKTLTTHTFVGSQRDAQR